MKRKITLFFAAVAGCFAANAQFALNESFNAPWTAAGAGWSAINLSAPASTNTPWFQGNPAAFAAFVGGTNNYIANNFQQIPANTAGGISSWLITPTLNLVNGAVLSFATRAPGTATVYADRMQVRMSQAGTNTVIPTGTTSVGTFTTLMLDINPLLNTITTNSAVNNGTVNGYPAVWTVYNLTVTGVTGTVSGRFAFRYFVDDGGQNGANSDYIGLDEVKYSIPCVGTVSSFTTCPSTSVTLMANGVNPGTTYTWNPGGSNASSITVGPAVTTVYSLTLNDNGTQCPVKTGTVTVGTNLSVNVMASSSTVCVGKSTTLTAMGGATSYTWSTLASGSSIVVTPTANTTYTVVGSAGACFGTNSITINTNPLPTITSTTSATLACTGTTVFLGGQGGTSYVWALGSQTTVANPVSLTTGTTSGVVTLTLTGTNAAGCSASIAVTQSVSLCTGINESSLATNLSVYPNPFANEINVSGVKGSIEVINMLGQVVLTTSVNENEKINTTNFAKGVYFVKVRNEQGVEVKTTKLVKN